MEKYKFEYNKNTEKYMTTTDEIEIGISEKDYNEHNVKRSIAIVKAYPRKLKEIARFCIESDTFEYCYPEFSKY